MGWRISSCFDCKLLQDQGKIYFCLSFEREIPYDIARTVNDCERKQPFDEERTNRDKLLDVLYDRCVQYATRVLGPFTVRELVLELDYQNKNSLWQMLEDLVKQGRLRKGKIRIVNRLGHIYRSNVYLPVWPKNVQAVTMHLAPASIGEVQHEHG